MTPRLPYILPRLILVAGAIGFGLCVDFVQAALPVTQPARVFKLSTFTEVAPPTHLDFATRVDTASSQTSFVCA